MFASLLLVACGGSSTSSADGGQTGGAPSGGSSTGGAALTGGAGGTGGAGHTGGAPATGGAGHTGGAPATGGAGHTGGAPATGGGTVTGGSGSGVNGAGPFPSTAVFYQDISQAPADSESPTIIAALDKAGWALGIDVSFTILTADASLARTSFKNEGDTPDCDTSPVPLPPGGNVESSSDYHCDGGDCHLLVYQGKRLYEGYQADFPQGKSGTMGCLVVWDLTRDYWQPKSPPSFSRGDGCNGADAADLPMAPLILTKEDVTSGELKHALRFTIPNQRIRAAVYVHPATHIGGPTGGADMPPYGARLRLKSTADLSKLSAAGQVVAKGLQRYGMFLADGGNLYVSATTDVADVVSPTVLRSFKATDFEMVDGGTRYKWSDYDCKRTVVSD